MDWREPPLCPDEVAYVQQLAENNGWRAIVAMTAIEADEYIAYGYAREAAHYASVLLDQSELSSDQG
jgi:hypothetical protein